MSTQNDIEEEKKRKEILYGICMAMTFDQFDTFMDNLESEKKKELADERREVIEEVEKELGGLDCGFCNYEKEVKERLAALKEETK